MMFNIGTAVQLGALLAYGPNFPAMFRRAANDVDKILHGTTQTRRRPAIIVAAMAAHVSHRVDRGRSAYLRDHSITSSARARSVGGTSRPSALAVLRLITSSYLVGACTGRSAGFSPLRMRST